MTDPLDTLRSDDDAMAPDQGFRTDLLTRLSAALGTSPLEADAWSDTTPSSTTQTTEVTMLRQQEPRNRRSMITIGVAVVATAAAVVGIVLIAGDDPASPAPQSDFTVPDTVPTVSAEEIIAAGLLGATDIADGYRLATDQDTTFTLDRETGPGADSDECAPFLDTVFESADRPAAVAARGFASAGAAMQQYVVVFPDEAGAEQMMQSVADPRFADCWAVVAFEAYTASDPRNLTERSTFDPVPSPHSLDEVGDDMVVVELAGTFVYGGTTFEDRGPTVFVREGRAVTFLNPNSANTVLGQPGYPDEQLQHALATAVDRLDAIQQF